MDRVRIHRIPADRPIELVSETEFSIKATNGVRSYGGSTHLSRIGPANQWNSRIVSMLEIPLARKNEKIVASFHSNRFVETSRLSRPSAYFVSFFEARSIRGTRPKAISRMQLRKDERVSFSKVSLMDLRDVLDSWTASVTRVSRNRKERTEGVPFPPSGPLIRWRTIDGEKLGNGNKHGTIFAIRAHRRTRCKGIAVNASTGISRCTCAFSTQPFSSHSRPKASRRLVSRET